VTISVTPRQRHAALLRITCAYYRRRAPHVTPVRFSLPLLSPPAARLLPVGRDATTASLALYQRISTLCSDVDGMTHDDIVRRWRAHRHAPAALQRRHRRVVLAAPPVTMARLTIAFSCCHYLAHIILNVTTFLRH